MNEPSAPGPCLLAIAQAMARVEAPPAVVEIYCPEPRPDPAGDAEFGVVRLADGSAGLYYAWLGSSQREMAKRFEHIAPSGTHPLALARLYLSSDEAERSIGLAAINAITAWWWRRHEFRPPVPDNSFGVVLRSDDRLGFIGNFPPLVRRAREEGRSVVVVERKSHMWREEEGLLVTGRPEALLDCTVIVATASMCLNDSLDSMLPWCRQARSISLVGPTAGFDPTPLFARGISAVGGVYLSDAETAIARMRAGGRWNDCALRYLLTPGTYPERLLVPVD